jgi:PAS domain S-box-containing protein
MIDTAKLDELFYRDVFDNAPDAMFSVDVDSGKLLACNRAFVETFGADEEELLGSRELEIYDPDSRDRVREAYETMCREGIVENVEVRVEPAGGEPFEATLSATAVERDGDVVASRSILRDITPLKEVMRDLENKTERLEQSNRELEQFAYLASHDLQEPLRMVASYTQLLSRRYEDELDEQASRYIDYAVEGAERMKALIDDLLTYSRVGRGETPQEVVDLDEVMEAVTANLRVKIEETDAEVDWGSLPTVEGNPTQLVKLFQNLVENAIKFDDEPPPRVAVEAERLDGEVCVSVSDAGVGFEPEEADRVFQIFQRLHERGAYDGTGAGLAIVKKVVEYHDGEISVDSTPGEGTTFEVTLPVEH